MSMGVLEATRTFAIAVYYRAHPYKTDRRCKFFLHWNTKTHIVLRITLKNSEWFIINIVWLPDRRKLELANRVLCFSDHEDSKARRNVLWFPSVTSYDDVRHRLKFSQLQEAGPPNPRRQPRLLQQLVVVIKHKNAIWRGKGNDWIPSLFHLFAVHSDISHFISLFVFLPWNCLQRNCLRSL